MLVTTIIGRANSIARACDIAKTAHAPDWYARHQTNPDWSDSPKYSGLDHHMKRRQLLAEHIFIANIRRHFDRTIRRDSNQMAGATDHNSHRAEYSSHRQTTESPRNHLAERQQMDFVIARRIEHILIRVQPQPAVEILHAPSMPHRRAKPHGFARLFGLIPAHCAAPLNPARRLIPRIRHHRLGKTVNCAVLLIAPISVLRVVRAISSRSSLIVCATFG